MIITPFANMATQAPAGWTPADFTDVQYWWTADAGVTESGGVVSAWTDQINSFQYDVAVNSPTLTTNANLGGQNVISLNGTNQYIYSTGDLANTSGSDWTVLQVMDLTSLGTGGAFMGYIMVGTNNFRWMNDTLNGSLRHFNQAFGGQYVMEDPAITGAKFVKTRYDESTNENYYAVDTLTETLGASAGGDMTVWSSQDVLVIGATLNSISNPTVFSGRYVGVDVAEQVWIYGTPTSQEMTDYKTYVNNKYGTIIS